VGALDARSLRAVGAATDHHRMDHEIRLVDEDLASLQRRVDRVLAQEPAARTVLRFTYWYTARPPVHEAVLVALPRAQAA
jgi:hypothetical protein